MLLWSVESAAWQATAKRSCKKLIRREVGEIKETSGRRKHVSGQGFGEGGSTLTLY